jgi:hypothetical protein
MDQATAVLIANERQGRMVAEAHFRLQEQDIGPTQTGVSDYALPDSLENLSILQVGADTVPYLRASPRQMIQLRSGTGSIDDSSVPGAFAIHASASGVKQVRIWPTPTTSGTAILAWATVDASALTYATATPLVVPGQVHLHLLSGCIASGYEITEDRIDLAASHEQVYEQGIAKLTRFGIARLDSGPAQVGRGW